MREGQPPFVLSDAFPHDLFPIPATMRLADPPGAPRPQSLKHARWLARQDFNSARHAGVPPAHRWLPDPFSTTIRRHNTLRRDNDSSLEEGGLFAREDITWNSPPTQPPGTLTLYARVQDEPALHLLVDLLHELALTGFGADVSTGRGQFDVVGDPAPDPDLDTPPPGANGLIVLSTFQPAPGDPTDGFWEAFPRFGKLGPDLDVADVRKHTLILFRPGACFYIDTPRPFLGRPLPMHVVLPADTASHLQARGIHIIHPAFGLAIPARLPEIATS
jgi:CRISPR-associated protein Csm4